MALLFFDGFDAGPMPEWTITTTIGGGRTSSGAAEADANWTLPIPASAKITTGFAYISGGTATFRLVSFHGDSGATQHISLYQAGRDLQARLGTTTIVAPGLFTVADNVWYYIEVQAIIADAGGRFIVKVDGATVLDFTGDTKNGGTSTNIDTILYLANPTGGSWRTDDLYVLDGTDDTATTGRVDNTFLGDMKVATLYPDADGATNQWVGSDGNSVQNYLLVDEPGNPNTTDYVGSATVGQRDLYGINDLPAGAQSVLGLKVYGYMAKSDAGAASAKLLTRLSDGSLATEAVATLSTSWQTFGGPLRKVKPSGGVWSVADVNALQIGVEVS